MLSWVVLWCLVPVGGSLWVVLRRGSELLLGCNRGTRARYFLSVGLEHLAVALQGWLVWRGVGSVVGPPLRDGLLAVGVAWCAFYLLLDAALYARVGMRMELRLVQFAEALTAFADSMPWRVPLGLAVVAALGLGGAAWWGASVGLFGSVSLGFTLGGFFLVAGLSWWLRRPLPVGLKYGWNNRLWSVQRRWLNAALMRLRPHAGAGGLPAALVAQQEESSVADPAYPLMRTTRRFLGKKHFECAVRPGEKPHVVFLFIESFRAADVGVLGAPRAASVTPCFDALASQGVLWTQFFANGTTTSRAMAAALYGLLPSFNEYSTQAQTDPPPLRGLPHLLAERGYLPAFFCDGPMEWENKRDFFFKQGFCLFYGAPSIREVYPPKHESVWNFPDELLMRFHVDWLARQQARGMPTFSTVLTVTNHTPYEAPEDAPWPEAVTDRNTDYGMYLRTMAYSDACLGLYVDMLRERGLAENTLLFVTADNGQRFDSAGALSWDGSHTDAGLRIPLLLLAPGRLHPTVVHETASHVDLMPTVIDILGGEATHHGHGTSLVREYPERQALSIHPWAPDMVTCRFGPYRYVYSFDAGEAALYHMLDRDKEGENIARQFPDLVTQQTQSVWAVRHTLNSLYASHRIAPPRAATVLPFPRLDDAPDTFPVSVDACATRQHEVMEAFKGGAFSGDRRELNIYMAMKPINVLSEEDKLKAVQLYLQRLWVAQMGELTNEERAELKRLHGIIDGILTAPNAPFWARVLAQPLQLLATIRARDSHNEKSKDNVS